MPEVFGDVYSLQDGGPVLILIQSFVFLVVEVSSHPFVAFSFFPFGTYYMGTFYGRHDQDLCCIGAFDIFLRMILKYIIQRIINFLCMYNFTSTHFKREHK